MDTKLNGVYVKYIKRGLDIFLSAAALLLFWWLLVIIAILVRVKMGAPILYTAERVGKDEKTFKLYKFRSMTNETDENGVLLPSPQRLTRFGRILRSTSLDELASLLNILKGDISIVGPRPLPVKYLPYYRENEHKRHLIRPGLTGWAQINGRNAISWDKKFALDLEYVNKVSFGFDVKVLFMTVSKVLKRSDIIQDDQQTASLHIVRADMNTEQRP